LVVEGRGAQHERDVPFGVAADAFDEHDAAMAVGGLNPVERFRRHRALRSAVERPRASRTSFASTPVSRRNVASWDALP
jgi:hypothetical protein